MSDESRQLWLLHAGGTPRRDVVADVAIFGRTPTVRTYGVPAGIRDRVSLGAVVRVKAKRRALTGICVRLAEREWDHTRPVISEVVQSGPLLTPALAELGLRASEYYCCPPGRTFAAMIPARMRAERIRRRVVVRLLPASPQRKPTAGQQRVLELLAGGARERQALCKEARVSTATLRTLRDRGLVEFAQVDERANDSYQFDHASIGDGADEVTPAANEAVSFARTAEDEFVLNAGQNAALEAIAADAGAEPRFHVNVLFGIPGSGKTEVYIRAIRQVIERGRQAILLVPEIVLATQIVERLARRFPRVAVLHSRLTESTRLRNLRAIAAGEADVVIGTRSAVFAPCTRLGLIVVDEEQESSYKSLAAPLFHARDAAIMRAKIEGIPVVLGSATPALETWLNCRTMPHYRLLRLPERAPGARLPTVRLISTAERGGAQRMARVMTPELVEMLRAALADRQQAILLHNRRGFAVHLKCERCGLLIVCHRCGAHMVFHRSERAMKCHRCGSKTPAPTRCLDESCGGPLMSVGLGIQRLEEELQQVLPAARLLRLDRDTLKSRADYLAALERFENRDADILLGTQIVAKGLDFPGVQVVGVIDADAALRLPDFRAAERVFQLMMQVVGRAGRREGESIAVVQSDAVDSAALQCAARLDYEAFAEGELALRQRYFLPPYSRMARLILTDDRPRRARNAAAEVYQRLRELAPRMHPDLHVDEAGPCVMRQIRGMVRWQVTCRGPRDGGIQRLLERAQAEHHLSPAVRRFVIDVDPIELL